MHRLSRVLAALLLAFLAATAVLPVAAESAETRGCHCVVRMACCEDGTCLMGEPEPPATGPEWRTCRREAPATTTSVDAFERALLDIAEERDTPATGSTAAISPGLSHSASPIPATPPPR